MATCHSTLTQAELKRLLLYDPATGQFTWRVSVGQRGQAGSRAGWVDTSAALPYRRIEIKGRTYRAHRLAWLYVHGHWPSRFVDHRDGNSLNNRIANLRLATNGENKANAKLHGNNRAKLKGVSAQSSGKGWRARIQKDGKPIHIGTFDTPEEAHAAYVAAARVIHREFARAS